MLKSLASKSRPGTCLIFLLGIGWSLFFPFSIAAQHDTVRAGLLYEQGRKQYKSGDYESAKQSFSSSLALRNKYYGERHPLIRKTIWKLADAERNLRNNKVALGWYQIILKYQDELEWEDKAGLYMDLGNVYNQMFQPEEAASAYDTALVLFEKNLSGESIEAGNVYMNIAGCYQKMGHLQDAERIYQRAMEIFNKASKPGSEDFNRIYNNIGYLYRKMGDLPKSLQYAEKALDIKLKNYPPGHPGVAKYHSNIGRVYQEMNQPEKALPYIQKAYEIEKNALGPDHPSTAGALGDLAGVYANLRQYDKALSLYKDAIAIMKKNGDDRHPYYIAGFVNIGAILVEMNRREDALTYFGKARQMLNHLNYPPAKQLADTERYLAKTNLELGRIKTALKWCRVAMMHLAPGFDPGTSDFISNPDMKMVQDNPSFIKTLLLKSEAFERMALKDKRREESLKRALENTALAVKVVDNMRKSFISQASRLYLRSETAPLYRTAVRLCFLLYRQTKDPDYFWKALGYVEQSQANVLRQSLQDDYALQHATLPKSVVDELDQLQRKLGQLESAWENSESDQEIRQRLNELHIRYTNTIAGLEVKYPDYYALKYAAPELDPQRILQKLPDNRTALCVYFYDESEVYIFLVKKSGLAAQSRHFGSSDFDAIKYLQSFDLSQAPVPANREEYIRHLNELYETLIAPVSADLENCSALYILPYGILQYLPFGVLSPVSEEKDFRRMPYLLRRFSIQNLWSLQLWLAPNTEYHVYREELLGLAPLFKQGNAYNNIATSETVRRFLLKPLPYSGDELKAAEQFYRSKLWIGASATKASFLRRAPESRILHLATHAFVDDQFPLRSGIVFAPSADTSGEILGLSELYRLRLHASMAVISACNSGFGQLAEGEGVLSLGRGFRYAGCRSVLMNQWPANDRSAAAVMRLFYENLADGMRKDEALRQAKLAYLASADALTAHPFFWAGIVCFGDNQAIPVSGNRQSGRWWIWIPGIAVLWAVFWLWRKST